MFLLAHGERAIADEVRFPQYTNASLQETLTVNFARHGGAAADKRWKLLST